MRFWTISLRQQWHEDYILWDSGLFIAWDERYRGVWLECGFVEFRSPRLWIDNWVGAIQGQDIRVEEEWVEEIELLDVESIVSQRYISLG